MTPERAQTRRAKLRRRVLEAIAAEVTLAKARPGHGWLGRMVEGHDPEHLAADLDAVVAEIAKELFARARGRPLKRAPGVP